MKNKLWKAITKIRKWLWQVLLHTLAQMEQYVSAKMTALAFGCGGIAVIMFFVVWGGLCSVGFHGRVDYSRGQEEISSEMRFIAHRFTNENLGVDNQVDIQSFIDQRARNAKLQILIVDLDGNLLYSAGEEASRSVDLPVLLKKVLERNSKGKTKMDREKYEDIYPLNFRGVPAYLVVRGIPEGVVVADVRGNGALAGIIALVTFAVLFWMGVQRKIYYIQEIARGLTDIAQGDLKREVPVRGRDELAALAVGVNHMGKELELRLARERNLEKMKNQLVTDMSHDLRTPLTSVIGYLGLLREKGWKNEEQRKEYEAIAYQKALQIQTMMEDLFEYAKLTGREVGMEKKTVDLRAFLEQLVEEYWAVGENAQVKIVKNMPGEPVIFSVDPDKMLRVFENLLMNAVKHSTKPGEIVVALRQDLLGVTVEFFNQGEPIDPEEIPRLFNRFYRMCTGESNSGSGLGLAIAKEIVEQHGGKIGADCENTTLRFWLWLPAEEGGNYHFQ